MECEHQSERGAADEIMSDIWLYPGSGAGGNRMQSAANQLAVRLSKPVRTAGKSATSNFAAGPSECGFRMCRFTGSYDAFATHDRGHPPACGQLVALFEMTGDAPLVEGQKGILSHFANSGGSECR